MLTTIQDLIKLAKSNPQRKVVAIAAADDAHTVEAALRAKEEGFVEPIFVGEKALLCRLIADCGGDAYAVRIINEPTVAGAAAKAVELVRNGEADFLQKGRLNTSDLLRAILNKETGLQHGKVVTHITFTEFPDYHKIIGLVDVAILPAPTLEQRVGQIEAVTEAMHKLGYGDDLKIAAIAAAEGVNPKIIESREGAELKRMNEEGTLTGCIVEGPISLDLALSKKRAQAKGYESPVAGDADILLFPTLVSGSVTAKILEMEGFLPIGIVLGAGVPIAVSSRAATAEIKYNTLIVAAMMV